MDTAAVNGVWDVAVGANDVNGNQAPAPATPQTTFTVAGASSDAAAPPQVVSVTVASSPVSPGDTLTVDAVVTDATGVSSVFQNFRINGQAQNPCVGFQNFILVSGTVTAGTWRYECTVATTAVNGVWDVFVGGTDVNGNHAPAPATPQTTFTVAGASSDAAPPQVVSVTASSPVSPGDTLTIDAVVTDATGVASVFRNVRINGQARNPCVGFQNFFLLSGTVTNGTWRHECTVATTAVNGVWNVFVGANDVNGNQAPAPATPQTTFTVTGGV